MINSRFIPDAQFTGCRALAELTFNRVWIEINRKEIS
jgi:hypothetical protein